ncbi:MAG: helix-turn-helix transcriptional regulator, partial [Spirochaetales bacterium]|nr:helix-turn-helix transcriptional regulator [Spirochaetales bacterium]
ILLRENLKTIISPFGRDISSCFPKLSRRELEICNMVKNGFSNKEIAQSLTLSLLTIEKHRQRIRKKLGITNEKVNLATYLQNL